MAYAALNDYENLILGLVCGFYFIMFGVYLYVFFIYIKYVSKLTLHINLKVLLYHIPIPTLVNMCAQIFQRIQFFANIEKIRNPWNFLIVCSDTAAFANFYQLDVLVIERMYATVWGVSSYENLGNKFPMFATILLAAQWIFSIITFISAHIENVYHYVACIIGLVNILVAVLVFIFLPRISRKIHDEFLPPSYEALKMKQWKSSTLSQRYQSCENLRVAVLIKVLIGVELLSVITQIGIHATIRSLQPYAFFWYIALHVGYFNLIIHSLALMLLVLQPCFSKIDSCRAAKRAVVPIESPEVVNKMYFDVYSKAWA